MTAPPAQQAQRAPRCLVAAASPLTAYLLTGPPWTATVLGVLPSAVYLRAGGHQDVLALLAADATALPTGLRLPLVSRRLRWDMTPGQRVVVGEGAVHTSGLWIQAVRVWRPSRVGLLAAAAAGRDVRAGVAGRGGRCPPAADDQHLRLPPGRGGRPVRRLRLVFHRSGAATPGNVDDGLGGGLMTEHVGIRRGCYYDSVSLMQVSRAVAGTDGVDGALVAMATELNLELLSGMGFERPEAGPNDLLAAAP